MESAASRLGRVGRKSSEQNQIRQMTEESASTPVTPSNPVNEEPSVTGYAVSDGEISVTEEEFLRGNSDLEPQETVAVLSSSTATASSSNSHSASAAVSANDEILREEPSNVLPYHDQCSSTAVGAERVDVEESSLSTSPSKSASTLFSTLDVESLKGRLPPEGNIPASSISKEGDFAVVGGRPSVESNPPGHISDLICSSVPRREEKDVTNHPNPLKGEIFTEFKSLSSHSSGSVPTSSSSLGFYRVSTPPLTTESFLPPSSAGLAYNNKATASASYNWQATKMTVKERLAFLFDNSLLSDVAFVVGRDQNRQKIPAHRFVLSVGSAVFDAMFNSTLATEETEIELPDVEPASFLALLRFLYSDEVHIGPETVMTTLYTAKKYAVPALEKHCVEFLKHHLSADNAFMLLTQARLFDEPQLAALCLETIDLATPEALAADGFVDIDVDTLSVVLDRDSLRIKEAKLFSAILRWAEAKCMRQSIPATPENMRSVLSGILDQVRFPLMTVEEFAQGPAQSGILTDKECVSLFLHFTINPKPRVAFLDVPRCSMTGKEQTVSRFQQIESRWGYSGTSDKIRFIVDRRIYVVGFGLYGSIHGPSEYFASIRLLHTGSGRQLGANEVSFSSDGTNATFRVMFKDPVEVQPNTNYTASATLKGVDSHYGTKGLRKVSVECPTGGKVIFQFSYAAGNNNGTSVEDGQIPEVIFYT